MQKSSNHKPKTPDTMKTIKTPSDLKYYVERAGHDSHFFTRSSMRFFGDRMSNYGIRKARPLTTCGGIVVNAYELTRKRPVKHGLRESAWFNAATFARVFPAREEGAQ